MIFDALAIALIGLLVLLVGYMVTEIVIERTAR